MITVARGESNTFVESRAPPSPVSSNSRSAGSRANASIAAAVVTSKKVTAVSPLASSTSSSKSASPPSLIRVPARRIRSLKWHRCGDEYTCTRRPAASAMARISAITEPLPLVPATCTVGGSL